MTTEKLWTVNAIKAANRKAGGHWFDPDAMRTFGTKVLPEVYQGPGGVFFVTQDDQYRRELPKRYTVRTFNPETGDVGTHGDLCEHETQRAAIYAAEDAAGVGATKTTESYKPVSVLEQFTDDLTKHCKPASPLTARQMRDNADQLIDLARRHHRLMEKLCNGELRTNADGESRTVQKCRDHVMLIAQHIGATGAIFSGDPRGCTVKLTFPDGHTNDFGREGYCVPTGDDD